MEQNINPLEKKLKLNSYQAAVITTDKRNAALVAGVGTGKTLAGILRGFSHNEFYPGSLGLIVRKEFTDLRDSTLKDFENNFRCKVSVQSKTFTHKNGSQILFRHGDLSDLNILKNINLSWFVIEQAEEYDTAAVYDFLRDRLRRTCGPQWSMIICNANGHNWVYKRFIENVKPQIIDERTGQYLFEKENSICATANTFANKHNLPPEFIADLLARAEDNPEHHQQYVMNNFNVVSGANLVFNMAEIESLRRPQPKDKYKIGRVMGVDIARFGRNESVAHILDIFADGTKVEFATESWQGMDAIFTQGKIFDLITRHNVNVTNIDSDGLGGPMLDNVRLMVNNSMSNNGSVKYIINEYHNTRTAGAYQNKTTELYFKSKEAASLGKLYLKDQRVIGQLAERKYLYNGGAKVLESKKEWAAGQGLSPDFADAHVMALEAAELLHTPFEQDLGNIRQSYDLSSNFGY